MRVRPARRGAAGAHLARRRLRTLLDRARCCSRRAPGIANRPPSRSSASPRDDGGAKPVRPTGLRPRQGLPSSPPDPLRDHAYLASTWDAGHQGPGQRRLSHAHARMNAADRAAVTARLPSVHAAGHVGRERGRPGRSADALRRSRPSVNRTGLILRWSTDPRPLRMSPGRHGGPLTSHRRLLDPCPLRRQWLIPSEPRCGSSSCRAHNCTKSAPPGENGAGRAGSAFAASRRVQLRVDQAVEMAAVMVPSAGAVRSRSMVSTSFSTSVAAADEAGEGDVGGISADADANEAVDRPPSGWRRRGTTTPSR